MAAISSDFSVALQEMRSGEPGRGLASPAPLDLRRWREWGVSRLIRIQEVSDQLEASGVKESPSLESLESSADDLVLAYSYADLGEEDLFRETLIQAALAHDKAHFGLCKALP